MSKESEDILRQWEEMKAMENQGKEIERLLAKVGKTISKAAKKKPAKKKKEE